MVLKGVNDQAVIMEVSELEDGAKFVKPGVYHNLTDFKAQSVHILLVYSNCHSSGPNHFKMDMKLDPATSRCKPDNEMKTLYSTNQAVRTKPLVLNISEAHIPVLPKVCKFSGCSKTVNYRNKLIGHLLLQILMVGDQTVRALRLFQHYLLDRTEFTPLNGAMTSNLSSALVDKCPTDNKRVIVLSNTLNDISAGGKLRPQHLVRDYKQLLTGMLDRLEPQSQIILVGGPFVTISRLNCSHLSQSQYKNCFDLNYKYSKHKVRFVNKVYEALAKRIPGVSYIDTFEKIKVDIATHGLQPQKVLSSRVRQEIWTEIMSIILKKS